mgnify:CR=1 FL=1
MTMTRTVEFAQKSNEFVTAADGYVYYWPSGFAGGCFNAQMLRELADELDKRNEEWDKQVEILA